MAALKTATVALSLALAGPCRSESIADWTPYITEASSRFGIPATWIERVIQAESNGQIMSKGHPVRSNAGAIGLMQLMPQTWETARRRLKLGNDPDDPRANILAGTSFLRTMYDRFGYPGLFAAYNAGPHRFAEHLATGRALPHETTAYLEAISGRDPGAPDLPLEKARDTLFAVRGGNIPTAVARRWAGQATALFVVHNDAP